MSGPVKPELLPTERQTGVPRPDETPTDRLQPDVGATPPPAAASQRLGPYLIVGRLGEGGMGVVYEARDTTLDRPVALKVMRADLAADPESRSRFLREAKAIAAIRNDHVVTVYQVGEENGVPYLAMELLRGAPLDRYLVQQKPISFSQAIRIGREAALGLAAAHARGIVHRDVKPANLWLEAPTGRVKVLDFGLARPAEDGERLTSTGVVMGTPAFMSPEHARGDTADARSDLFSLGGVLFRLVAGRLPFPGVSTMAVLTALAVDTPPKVRTLVPDVPPDFGDIIDQLLAKDPAKRPTSADDVARRLRAVGKSRSGPNPTVTIEPLKPKRRWWIAAAAASVLLTALAGVIIWITNPDGSKIKIEAPDGATVKVERDGKAEGEVVVKAPPVPAGERADVPPPPPFERKIWHRDDNQGGFERTGGKNWRELSPDRPGGSFTFVEVRTTPDYIDLYDVKRDMTLRFYPDGVDLLGDGKWGRLYDGHWFDPNFRPPEGKAKGKGPEGKGKGGVPKAKTEPKGPPG